ncbi:MAG: TIGR03960 family B12-binding radical SAM protein [Clostridia bacterium]|nr:TIGR03960 family B12-binding radical SAM protein [Clostridia bacterium]
MGIDKELESILKRVEKPARYIGGEVNMVRKNPDDVSVRIGFAFPDTYEIGMSYMGMQILYNILNGNDRICCERVFAPAADMEEIMREKGRKLYTLETFTPVDKLDVLGFTLQYEMSYTNILNMLDLGGIPVRKDDRKDGCYPLIIAGGPCAFNPEPLADFVDAFLIGDGEETLEKVCLAFADAKAGKPDRKAFLEAISEIDGVYVPEFYDVEYGENHSISAVKKINDRAPETVTRAIVKDIEGAEFPVNNIVPYIDTVHDRSVVETFRGCTRGCRFCQAGMIYRPVRERKPDTIENLAMEQLANTGHEELSLLSLSTSDYSQFEPMATGLMGLCRKQNVALSLPSLRLDSFSFRVLDEIQGYRKSGLTFAPEAGTQRLRDVINKNITEDDIFSATRQAVELGWEHIKLYFMIGLPTETLEDLDGIAEIARKIMDINYDVRGRKGGRFRVTVSVSNFVPKPHTPFQWEAQNTAEEFIEKHNYLSSKLRIKGVTFNYHETATSNLEAVFARGDRRCGRILEEAWKLGCRFDGWTEHFRPEAWRKAFENCAADLGFDSADDMEAFYNYRERTAEEILPWDMINPFVSRDYFLAERNKAVKCETTHDCREGCTGCGVNRYTDCFVNCKQK